MSTAPVNHLSLASKRVMVPAERDGGATVYLPPVSTITVVPLESGPTLRAVELHVPASIKVLDLSGLAPAPWVSVVGGRGLEQLVLPCAHPSVRRGSQAGAEVHLALDGTPALRVDGAVAALDACWPDPAHAPAGLHTLRARGPGRRPWTALWLGEQAPAQPVDTLILHGIPGTTHLDLSALPPFRSLELHNTALETIHLGTLDQLTIEACPGLTATRWQRVERALLRKTHALEAVHGTGRALSLSGVRGDTELTVQSDWARLSLRDSTWTTLTAPGARSIRLHGDSHVETVVGAPGHHLGIVGLAVPHAPAAGEVEVQPAYIEVISRLLAEGRAIHPQVLDQWLAAAHGPSGIQDRLMALAVGLEAGSLTPDATWTLRCQLAHRGGEPQDVAGDPAWRWRFMADLADRGWAADLAIWWTCRETVAAARQHDALVERTQSMLALAALAEALQTIPRLGPYLRAALDAPLPVVPARRRWRGPYPHEEVEADGVFARVVRGLVRARNALDVAPVGEALARNLQTRIKHHQPLMGVLSSLHQLGVANASNCLAELATTDGLDPAVQREALVALLAAPHPDARPLLARQEASA